MKQTITSALIAVVLAASFTTAQVVYAQDLQKGVEAAQKGDYAAALREWRPLVAQGIAKAQYNLGLMYYSGQGVTQDYKEAVRLFGLAAAQGNANAQFRLGFMYEDGQGVTQDYKEAVRLYGLAAAQGEASAQVFLGDMYGKGLGVIQDNVYAHMWWNIAASSGDATSKLFRDMVAEKMTAVQLEKAQDLARECVKKNYKGC